MVDLKAKPFYLSDEDIRWVQDTIASMSEEEKVGQLFVNMVQSREPEDIRKTVDKYHIGALRYMNAPAEELYEQNRLFQEQSRIPLLIASNCEAGGNGGVGGGTPIANGAAIAAADSEELAYRAALIGGREGAAIGCNWNFAPVVDILQNWRNTVVQLRAYNDNPEDIIRYARGFHRGTKEAGLATCAKHFPGDGTEENDQHLMMGINDLSTEQWDATFGKVYQALIDDGVMTIMAGHIAQPAWQRRLAGRELRDNEILPATLCPELITGLLRERLHFNGLVVTDASHMIGMFAAMPRSRQVPQAIAAGCDMFLFFNDYEEDFGYMLQGYRSGVITEERMNDALTRILGLKAALGLHRKKAQGTLLPEKENISIVGCEEHQKQSYEAANQYITLVKDTQKMLPLLPATHPRIRLVFISGEGRVVAGKLLGGSGDQLKAALKEELEQAGFTVDTGEDMAFKGKMEELHKKYDAVIVALDVVGFAQYNAMRVKWAKPIDQPWYTAELPTAFVSFNLTNHLVDLTMSRTYINVYMDHAQAVRAFVEKLTGKSPFNGRYNENVWCGRWDTRL
ncbi:MAG: glycosyl hydrolase [Provencibacterium sp.]|nr:glycosyl hydrolase [Provencibacterium sp.]